MARSAALLVPLAGLLVVVVAFSESLGVGSSLLLSASDVVWAGVDVDCVATAAEVWVLKRLA